MRFTFTRNVDAKRGCLVDEESDFWADVDTDDVDIDAVLATTAKIIEILNDHAEEIPR